MPTKFDCGNVAENIGDYIEKRAKTTVVDAIDQHLSKCEDCREAIGYSQAVHGLIEFVQVEPETSKQEESKQPASLLDRVGDGAPWWLVSALLHVLVIALAGLISMAIELPKTDESVVMVTELAERKELNLTPDKPEKTPENVLASNHDTPPTDPTSKEASDIVVPPDILKKAEIGDHFETINPDRPDTQSAFGNPDAHMFHSVQGNDEPPGGGGVGGTGLEDLIGVGGAASPGTGGGWGGGNGTGTGVDNGAGHGSFGNRNGGGRRLMVKRHGGSKKTEDAVDLALQWLAYHQEPEGHWHAAKYFDNNEIRWGGNRTICEQYDPGVSGLATLAFLGAGHTLKVGTYRDNVQRAIKWFINQQGADGDFTSKIANVAPSSQKYCHCIATLACIEALGMNGGKDWGGGYDNNNKEAAGLKAACEKGIELILKWQMPEGGWNYPMGGMNGVDPTVTGWAVMALKSAKVAGMHIPPDAILKAMEATANLSSMDEKKGDYGHSIVGYRNKNAMLFNSRGYACTAAGMVINLFLGTPTNDPIVTSKAEFITQDEALPQWTFRPNDAQTDHQNLYYWYYGTLGCFQAGGDVWKKWNERLKPALCDHQCKDGDKTGSWDPDDVWGAWGGRVYSTALGALCLEVYYRYALLNPNGR